MAASRLVITPAAALAVGIAWLAWACWDGPAMPAAAPAVELDAPPPQAAAPLRPAAAAPVPAALPPPPAPQLAALLRAPDAELRASLHAALAARAQGGRLYARALARRCADLAALQPTDAPDANDPRHQRATARRAALSAGCGQFANAEWLALVNIAADEPAGDDPLLAVQQSDLDGEALLRAVAARPDPLLLDELGERLLLRRVDGMPVLFFDGQRFDTDAERALAQAALRLLPCEFGLACDERDPAVWLACLRGDGCAASRAQQEPAAALPLARRLAQALRGGELTRFLPPG